MRLGLLVLPRGRLSCGLSPPAVVGDGPHEGGAGLEDVGAAEARGVEEEVIPAADLGKLVRRAGGGGARGRRVAGGDDDVVDLEEGVEQREPLLAFLTCVGLVLKKKGIPRGFYHT